MTQKVHKIFWSKRFNGKGVDINLELTEVNLHITKATHRCANWSVGEPWVRVYGWFKKKHATITEGEPIEI